MGDQATMSFDDVGAMDDEKYPAVLASNLRPVAKVLLRNNLRAPFSPLFQPANYVPSYLSC